MTPTTPAPLPVIDVSALVNGAPERTACAAQIGAACREHGFFYVAGHGVDPALVQRLEDLSRTFFALPEAMKMQWRRRWAGAHGAATSRWAAS